MATLYTLLAFFAGALIPLQAGINAQLANRVDSTVWATMASFIGGALALVCYVAAARIPSPTLEKAATFPWWLWTGGLLGAFLVWAGITVAPRIGAASLVAFIVTGQLFASLVFDHFGWVGFPTQEITAGRIVGACLLLAGAILIRKF